MERMSIEERFRLFQSLNSHQQLASRQRRGIAPSICPKCQAGTLVKPNNKIKAEIQPDLVCDKCGAPYWHH
jgi:uncharacterized protein with PIN domain